MASSALSQESSPAPAQATKPEKTHYPWQFLDATVLKWIALICMLIDHTAAIFVWAIYLDASRHGDPNAAMYKQVYDVMRIIGRITFPIFCFVLTEGLVYTRSRPKYALRLFLFAVVSEIPYDLALHSKTLTLTRGFDVFMRQLTGFYTSQLNVIFTLLLGFCAIWLAEELCKQIPRFINYLANRKRDPQNQLALATPEWLCSLVTVGFLLIAMWLSSDKMLDVSYHEYGIMLIGGFYLARRWRLAQCVMGSLSTWWYCTQHPGSVQIWANMALVLLLFYNGKRGAGMKYLFYLFYPLHLLILWILKLWLL
ncbi:MAG: hypothetical protein IKE43_11275 [Coriobacteriales bacterium]|nr:hypothetical protein [Coriobacteriales bacterium]